jgi:site-specific recombinase XerD
VTPLAQQRAVVEALGLSPEDLRDLASLIEATRQVVLVRDIVEAELARLPNDHRYLKSLHRLMAWAGDQDAETLQEADVTAWARRARDEAVTDPRARHGVGAQEAFILATRAAYVRAVRAGTVRHNPVDEIRMPSRPASRRTALGCEQLAHVRLALLAHSRDPALDNLVFQLLRETACRRAGAIGLSRDDLGQATRTVRLVEKYDKQRWLPVSAHLMHRLVLHADARQHPGCTRVLHRNDGGHLNSKWFENFARRIQRLPWAGELGVSAHWLRHTTLTDIERVAGVRVAAAYAGHADGSLGVTGTYTKPSPEELRAAHARVFFDDDRDADDATTAPDLVRRARLVTLGQIEFTSAAQAPLR